MWYAIVGSFCFTVGLLWDAAFRCIKSTNKRLSL